MKKIQVHSKNVVYSRFYFMELPITVLTNNSLTVILIKFQMEKKQSLVDFIFLV